ncbi:Uu.00g076980.m01.CDS01 [Anthostomella pinea]|uniref:Uu.00g076980.m01.CDS01 n=1 Tax=Anthostomella pinea TaxID=933095 RepID=A0AAI8VX63_9PEZI|nr:Uu.00g076980.m01.CDS01 [Anthostomella pinea]
MTIQDGLHLFIIRTADQYVFEAIPIYLYGSRLFLQHLRENNTQRLSKFIPKQPLPTSQQTKHRKHARFPTKLPRGSRPFPFPPAPGPVHTDNTVIPTYPTHAPTYEQCATWARAKSDASCLTISKENCLKTREFLLLNPQLHGDSEEVWEDYWYCVRSPDGAVCVVKTVTVIPLPATATATVLGTRQL